MKLKLTLIFLIFIAFKVKIDAQIYTYHNTVLTYAAQPIGEFTDSSNQKSYGFGPYDIGIKNPYNNYISVKCRTYFVYDLSTIKENSTIDTVIVQYSTGSNKSYTFKITKLTTTGDDKASFESIGKSSSAHTGITYGNNQFMSSQLVTFLQSSLPSKKMILGVMSENETANDSYAMLNLTITVYYKTPAEKLYYIAKNDLNGQNGGHIGVGIGITPTPYQSPKELEVYETQSINLIAYDTLNVNNSAWLFNDTEAPLNKGSWKRERFTIKDTLGFTQAINFKAEKANSNATLTAIMSKNLKISRSDKTEFDGLINTNDVTRIVEQNSGTIPVPATKTVNNRTYNFAGWEQNATGVFTPTDNQTYPYAAIYKMTNKSNNGLAFTNNGQKKIIKDNSGNLHFVYESMDQIWYEKSTDNGATWVIQNEGKPISSLDGKNPSIDYYYHSSTGKNVIAVAYNDYWDTKLKIFVDGQLKQDLILSTGVTSPPNNYPNVTCSGDGNITVFISDYGIGYRRMVYEVFQNNVIWKNNNFVFPVNPLLENHKKLAVVSTLSGSNIVFHLAWEEPGSYSSKVKYMNLSGVTSSTTFNESAIEEVSAGAGFSYNSDPTITIINSKPYVSWSANAGYGVSNSTAMYRVRNYSNSWSNILSKYGSYISSVSINRTSDEQPVMVWSEENGNKNYVYNSGKVKQLYVSGQAVKGKYIQASNGSSLSDANAVTFNTFSAPFNFVTTGNFVPQSGGQTAEKSLNDSNPNEIQITEGRTAVISKDSVDFLFNIRNIKVDKKNITFRSLNDTDVVNTPDLLNNYLISEPFNLNDNSEFYVSASFLTQDSLKALDVLGKEGKIEVKVDIIDAVSEKSISSFNKKVISKNYLSRNIEDSYKINTKGIGNKSVYLRLSINTNLEDHNVNLIRNYYNDDKAEILVNNNLNLNEVEMVTAYDLLANYPNPFNPTTKISYQLPEAGLVTLKVYDMLGQEVTTLVNEFKDTGKYTVSFNAGQLSSGTYIYEIKVNDFRKTQKMMLVK